MDQSQSLRDWLRRASIELSPSLELSRAGPPSQTYSVHAASAIAAGASVCSIPKRAILSHRTASIGQAPLATLPLDTPQAFRLALCVTQELMLGKRSRWSTYFEHCPTKRVDIALLWSEDERALVRGTELGRELDRIGISQATLTAFYTAQSSLCSLPHFPTPPDVQLFLYAYSLVSSRAFQVDAFHTLALVPLADLFDHSAPNDVHLESDHFVCAECGSLQECEHDGVEGERAGARGDEAVCGEDDTCEMVLDSAVERGQVVFNTYGRLSNAQLLAYYGFALEVNELDGCSFEVKEFAGLGHDPVELARLWSLVEEDAEVAEALEELDGLVTARHDWETDATTAQPQRLWIDAEATVSWELWATAIATGAPLAPSASAQEKLDRIKQATLSLGKTWSSISREDDDASIEEEESSLTAAGAATLAVHVESIRSLLLARIASQHLPDHSGSELLTLAEEVSSTVSAPSKLALDLLANERLLLECVLARWDQIAKLCLSPTPANGPPVGIDQA